ncbi:MAG: ExeM/NucH family extracellular endonuclease [Myxococcota bacterium]|jgi:hypothetical protein|nr:ExeM/NucH family extracellular endonuclease [Myxococcota bacterium]
MSFFWLRIARTIAVGCCVATGAAAGFAKANLVRSDTGACGEPTTLIHEIQGTGRSSPLLGQNDVVVDAVVVASFPGFPDGLGGFFLQEEKGEQDGDPRTSEGLFVFERELAEGVSVGERVRVRGRVGEFFGMTELYRVSELQRCPTRGKARPVTVRLPVDDLAAWEQVEGMWVRLSQPLVATDHYGLERYGEIGLAAGGRLWQATHREAPGEAALARAAADARRRILLDDGSDAYRPRPTPYLDRRDGRSLRLGDRVKALEGVVEYAFGRYRIHPTRPPAFTPGRAQRPQMPPRVGGRVHVVSWNVANYFNGDGRGRGFPTRGARSFFEFERQRAKLVATLVRLDADIVALSEIENDGVGPDSAIAGLADELNRRTSGSPYVVVDPGRPRLASHAISVALLYRPASVEAVGPPSVLDRDAVDAFDAFDAFDDSRNRPSLAQTFEHRSSGERFTLAVNHFKSKGSSCAAVGDFDRGDGQGECNGTRTRAAQSLVAWLAENPSPVPSAPVLIVGDLNAYPREDPVRAIKTAGYIDLLRWFGGRKAYTFVFAGGAGRLDHALAQWDLLPFVTGAGVWHTNADEPSSFDYGEDNPPERYTPGPFRASDHDPVVVGLFPEKAYIAKERKPFHAAPRNPAE